MELLHALLRRHHAATRDQELAHFGEYESMKKRHLETQHESETSNQKEYMRRALEDMRKQHALQSKQQPRDLRVCTMNIRADTKVLLCSTALFRTKRHRFASSSVKL